MIDSKDAQRFIEVSRTTDALKYASLPENKPVHDLAVTIVKGFIPLEKQVDVLMLLFGIISFSYQEGLKQGRRETFFANIKVAEDEEE